MYLKLRAFRDRRYGFADIGFAAATGVIAWLREALGGCDNSNSPLSGNSNSFEIFCSLLLDGPFLF